MNNLKNKPYRGIILKSTIVPFLIGLTLLYFFPSSKTLTVIDQNTGQPIEGAIVYLEESHHSLRSNVNGQVSLPPVSDSFYVSIQAKNYQPQKFNLAEIPDNWTVQLCYDSTMANPAEKNLHFIRQDSLQGQYGAYRSNNDLLHYDLSIKIDIENKQLSGGNTITFTMLRDGSTIQIDLFKDMHIDSIVFNDQNLTYQRECNAVFIDFPHNLKKGGTHSIDFFYSGTPARRGRFGGISFQQDSLGNPWVFTACQGTGSSMWWPSKDQHLDEVKSMSLHFLVPSGLTAVSNGKFIGKEKQADGFTWFHWKVHYPINNYCVSVNVGKYTHFSDQLNDLSLDYYVLPYHLKKAEKQFQQVKLMLACYQKHFGEYPFKKDGYKLIEVPYSGMEHQTAVTYGNLFKNGYLGRDWTGVGISKKFDFIIIHESAHEWFGNSVTCGDYSDAWIHEGFGTYMEAVYVECQFGYEAAIDYLNGYKSKVKNRMPIVGPPGVNHWPTQDMYFKGALFLNTLRHIVNDDQTWWAMLYALHEEFKYQSIYITDVLNFFNEYLDKDLKPLFDQYLYHTELPVLQLKYEQDSVQYRWNTQVNNFNMPVTVQKKDTSFFIYPRTEWQSRPLDPENKKLNIATDLFYIDVEVIE
ncbi:MAG: M1 family metallopeptidase [bacterium]